jgi:hypothetical protein
VRSRVAWWIGDALLAAGCATPGSRADTTAPATDQADVWFMQHGPPPAAEDRDRLLDPRAHRAPAARPAGRRQGATRSSRQRPAAGLACPQGPGTARPQPPARRQPPTDRPGAAGAASGDAPRPFVPGCDAGTRPHRHHDLHRRGAPRPPPGRAPARPTDAGRPATRGPPAPRLDAGLVDGDQPPPERTALQLLISDQPARVVIASPPCAGASHPRGCRAAPTAGLPCAAAGGGAAGTWAS